MKTFDFKKFVALIGLENRLMQLFYDKAEAAGLEPHFDVYHVLAGDETPSDREIEIMKEIFEFNVKGTDLEKEYDSADIDFAAKIGNKNRDRMKGNGDNKHINN